MRTRLFVLLMVLCSTISFSYGDDYDYHNFKYGGLCYETSSDSTVRVLFYKVGYPPQEPYSGIVVIPEKVTYKATIYSVTEIGSDAFKGCSGLTSITIPSSVTSISGSAFSGCSGLTSIVVERGNTVYDSRDNCNAIIETAANTLIVGCKSTVIPNSVTSIGHSAFSGCSGLTSITIHKNVSWIDREAFKGCTGLTSITFKRFSAPVRDTMVFSGCSSLKDVYIPCGATDNYSVFSSYQLHEVFLPELTVTVEDTTMGTVRIDKPAICEDIEAVISAVPYTECTFLKWNDGNTDNPRTIRLTDDTTYTASFNCFRKCKIDVLYDNTMGTVSGIGTYTYGETAKLRAKANDGYKFSHWSDGKTVSMNFFIVTEDRTLEAFFIPATAVEDVKADKADGVQKVLRDGQVFILRNGKTYTTMGTEVQ